MRVAPEARVDRLHHALAWRRCVASRAPRARPACSEGRPCWPSSPAATSRSPGSSPRSSTWALVLALAVTGPAPLPARPTAAGSRSRVWSPLTLLTAASIAWAPLRGPARREHPAAGALHRHAAALAVAVLPRPGRAARGRAGARRRCDARDRLRPRAPAAAGLRRARRARPARAAGSSSRSRTGTPRARSPRWGSSCARAWPATRAGRAGCAPPPRPPSCRSARASTCRIRAARSPSRCSGCPARGCRALARPARGERHGVRDGRRRRCRRVRTAVGRRTRRRGPRARRRDRPRSPPRPRRPGRRAHRPPVSRCGAAAGVRAPARPSDRGRRRGGRDRPRGRRPRASARAGRAGGRSGRRAAHHRQLEPLRVLAGRRCGRSPTTRWRASAPAASGSSGCKSARSARPSRTPIRSPIEVAAELGLVGLVALASLLAGVALAARDALRRAPAAAAGPRRGARRLVPARVHRLGLADAGGDPAGDRARRHADRARRD